MRTARTKTIARFVLVAILAGAVFPAASLILTYVFHVQPLTLNLIIALAPVVLGLAGLFIGRREADLRRLSENQERIIADRTAALQSMLDVTGDGFLSIGPDLLVQPEYSKPCETVFGGPIAGKRFPDLLYVEERPRQDFVDGVELFFGGKAKAEVIFDLLDKEVELRDRVLELDYRAINEQTIMVSISDVTEQRALAAQVREEGRRRDLILRVVSNRKYFAGFMGLAEQLFHFLDALATQKTTSIPNDTLDKLAVELHTLKGDANFLGFTRTGTVAHDLEDQVISMPILETDVDLASEIFVLKRQYFEELNAIRDTLGDQWLQDLETIGVPANALQRVEQYVATRYPQDSKLRSVLEQFRRVPLRDLFAQYPQLVRDIAARRGRRIRDLEIAGGDFRVLPDRFEPLAGVLSHVIRNMVDHGIESPSEREMQGKDPVGTIGLSLSSSERGISISISDDGRGISFGAVEARAREQGMLSKDEKPTRQTLLSLIFRQGFSTAEAVSTVSGRGVGLPAVRRVVAQMGGKVSVETKTGRGTTFRIVVPEMPAQKKR